LTGTDGCADKKTLHCVDKFTFDCPDLPHFQRCSTIRRDFGSSSIWRFFDSALLRHAVFFDTAVFFDSAVLRLSSSSTWQFSNCADGCRRAKKLPETTLRDF
jgi:hypothetical protein